ncbi:acyltransferase [Arthrobacter sp. MYb211]|uniref:acyltransferase family protein n=1 Tax=unclassified Arthrobacter TaxID=235627 RepID=UPI000CFC5552|nr:MULTISPECIES: acyltransferase family protein [unclassified Arthrobacter]PRA11655.1 acyltransferase [Arthrobacter sp. MYb221]PRC07842.1 acyltransferase [Arthrobacter sp. MYb211]
MSSPPAAPKNFRPEIQALRALAVLLVVAYHLEPGLLPGGYIGVDIFFVISGFLITSHLLREAQRTGTVNLASFFAGRARRILPAAMLVILVVVAAALAIFPKTQWGTLTVQGLASAFSVQNWVLAADSVDYLASEQAPGPLQHFWSLGVEEQFYLFWPLLVLAACLLVKHNLPGPRADRFASRRRMLWIAFTVIALLSLGYSIFTGYSGDAAGYFVTTTRIWELAAGGLLALAADGHANGAFTLPRWVSSWSVRNALVLLALAAILGAAFSYDAQTVFPGIAAAVPVLGCAAIIAAGTTSGPGSLHALVNFAPVQWIGLASYSLYLWHWPLIVFATHLTGHDPTPVESLALMAGSLALAWASLRFVETPARHWQPVAASAKRSLLAGATMIAVVASVALIPGVAQRESIEREQQQVAALLQNPPAGFGAASVSAGAPAYLADQPQIIPVPATAEDDQPDLGECVQDPQSTQIKECEFGSKDATLTVALVGDSHAAHWFEALAGHAKERGWKIVTYLKNSCPFSAESRTAEREGGINCAEANEQTLMKLSEREDLNAVVAANWGGASFVGDAAQGYAEQWGKLENAGRQVYAVVDTPRPPQDSYARDCVEEHSSNPEQCSFDKESAFEEGDATRQAAKLEPRVQVLDFSDQFCIDQRCPAVIGNVLVYRDKHHVSDTYMRTLAPVFGQRLEAAMDGEQK